MFVTFKATPPYPDKFKPGDVAISTIDVDFTDGDQHVVGQRCKVTVDNQSYYNVWHKYYDKEAELVSEA